MFDLDNRLVFIPFNIWGDGFKEAKQLVQAHERVAGIGLDSNSFFWVQG